MSDLQTTGKPAQPEQIVTLLHYDDLGEMALTEKLHRACSTVVSPSRSDSQEPSRKPAGSTLRIVKDNLVKVDDGDCIGCLYAVKGSIYNPNNKGVKNVVVRYYIWKKWIGQDGHGSAIKETGGLVSATIMYLPPEQTVEFTATSHNAGVMTEKSGLLPDPISAEITAGWED